MDVDNMLIADMTFANKDVESRIRNTLQKAGVRTLGQLLQHTEEELRRNVPGFGAVCLAEVVVKLKRMGLSLKERRAW